MRCIQTLLKLADAAFEVAACGKQELHQLLLRLLLPFQTRTQFPCLAFRLGTRLGGNTRGTSGLGGGFAQRLVLLGQFIHKRGSALRVQECFCRLQSR